MHLNESSLVLYLQFKKSPLVATQWPNRMKARLDLQMYVGLKSSNIGIIIVSSQYILVPFCFYQIGLPDRKRSWKSYFRKT